MLEVIPTEFKAELRAHQRDAFLDLPVAAQTKLGLSVKDFFLIDFACLALYQARFEENLPIFEAAREYIFETNNSSSISRRQSEVICELIDRTSTLRHLFTFTAQDLVLARHESFRIEKVQAYLGLLV